MGYPKEILYTALSEVAERKLKAEKSAEARHEELRKKVPEFVELEQAVSLSGVNAAKLVFSGGDTKAALNRLMEETLRSKQKISEILEKARLPWDYLSPPYTCKICEDSGYSKNKICTCAMEIAKRIAYESLNERTPLSLSGFDNFNLGFYSDEADNSRGISPRKRISGIFEACKKYARDFGEQSENMLFLGGTGLGKTHLSLAIASEITKKGYGVIYGSAQDLLRDIEREHFSRQSESDYTLDLILSCDLLIFDDLGTEFTSPFIQSTIYNIINTRILKQKPTILSTNLNMSEIRSLYHERILSRLTGSYIIHEFFGRDVRLIKRMGK